PRTPLIPSPHSPRSCPAQEPPRPRPLPTPPAGPPLALSAPAGCSAAPCRPPPPTPLRPPRPPHPPTPPPPAPPPSAAIPRGRPRRASLAPQRPRLAFELVASALDGCPLGARCGEV